MQAPGGIKQTELGSHIVHAVSDVEQLLFLPMHIFLRDTTVHINWRMMLQSQL